MDSCQGRNEDSPIHRSFLTQRNVDHYSSQGFTLLIEMKQIKTFLVAFFEGEVIERLTYENEQAMHAEVRHLDTILMIGKASEEFPSTINTDLTMICRILSLHSTCSIIV